MIFLLKNIYTYIYIYSSTGNFYHICANNCTKTKLAGEIKNLNIGLFSLNSQRKRNYTVLW